MGKQQLFDENGQPVTLKRRNWPGVVIGLLLVVIIGQAMNSQAKINEEPMQTSEPTTDLSDTIAAVDATENTSEISVESTTVVATTVPTTAATATPTTVPTKAPTIAPTIAPTTQTIATTEAEEETEIIGPGTYKIGVDLAPGLYLILGSTTSSTYFQISPPNAPSDISANGNFYNHQYVEVMENEYLTFSGGYAVNGNDFGPSAADETPLVEGMYEVGKDIPAGEYKLTATSGMGYYAVYGYARHDEIEENEIFTANTYVIVYDGQFLIMSGCEAVGVQ